MSALPTRVDRRPEQLLDQVRVALGAFLQGLQGGRTKPFGTHGGADHRPGLPGVQWLQLEQLDLPGLFPAPDQLAERVVAAEILGPAGADQQQAKRPDQARQVVEELAAGGIGPAISHSDRLSRRLWFLGHARCF